MIKEMAQWFEVSLGTMVADATMVVDFSGNNDYSCSHGSCIPLELIVPNF